MGLPRQTVVFLSFVFALTPSCSNAAAHPRFRDLSLPLYVDHIRSPVAVIKVRHSERDHLQKGFFKFGVFPILKVDRLAIDVYHPEEGKAIFERTSETLSKLRTPSRPNDPDSKRKQGITGVNIEQFDLRLMDKKQVRLHLTADFASKFGKGQWKLRSGKLNRADTEQSFAKATLEITDQDFVLHLPSQPGVSLFSPTTKPSPVSKQTTLKRR